MLKAALHIMGLEFGKALWCNGKDHEIQGLDLPAHARAHTHAHTLPALPPVQIWATYLPCLICSFLTHFVILF